MVKRRTSALHRPSGGAGFCASSVDLRRIVVVAVFFAVTAFHSAYAQYNGAALLKDCLEPPERLEAIHCLSYVGGAASMIVEMQSLFPVTRKICFPPYLNRVALKDLVVEQLLREPAQARETDAADAIYAILILKFGCRNP